LGLARECASLATLARAKLPGPPKQTRGQNRLGEIAQINVRDNWVHFRISDVYIPEPAQILMQLHGKDLLQGKIIDLSDSGGQEDAYAVVEVDGISQPVVVAMKHVKGTLRE
jgi:hypothetical protein